MQFVDIKNDIAFRKIFGNEKKKVILISFLNAIMQLEGENRIADVTIANPYQSPILPNFKATILDVRAIDSKGNTFIVEMQVADVDGMDKRLLYYTSKEYSQQIESGEKYTELNPVIFIGIFDFPFSEGDYLSNHAICNVKTGERIIKDMDFYFIELPKFKKQLNELDNVTDKWIYFIKEAENLDVIPDNIEDTGLEEAYLYANKNTWSMEELRAYDYQAMREQDERGRMSKALRVAVKAAVEIAVEDAIKETNLATAKNLKESGVDINVIIQATGLTEKEINEL
jgi:predicted transposase/invertase (TIGR01784 family)